MTEQTWTFLDRSKWRRGEWDREPMDKIQWVDEKTGLDCLMHRNPGGAWCGYVGVPEGHPLFKVSYCDYDKMPDIRVHGGLTYSDVCQESKETPGRGICHVPLPGRPAHVWWLGFDCAHSGDVVPGYDWPPESFDSSYMYADAVKAECRKLAEQLAAVKP